MRTYTRHIHTSAFMHVYSTLKMCIRIYIYIYREREYTRAEKICTYSFIHPDIPKLAKVYIFNYPESGWSFRAGPSQVLLPQWLMA